MGQHWPPGVTHWALQHWPLVQTVPQPPQLFGSVTSLMHWSLQQKEVCVPEQHTPPQHVCELVHVDLQLPDHWRCSQGPHGGWQPYGSTHTSGGSQQVPQTPQPEEQYWPVWQWQFSMLLQFRTWFRTVVMQPPQPTPVFTQVAMHAACCPSTPRQSAAAPDQLHEGLLSVMARRVTDSPPVAGWRPGRPNSGPANKATATALSVALRLIAGAATCRAMSSSASMFNSHAYQIMGQHDPLHVRPKASPLSNNLDCRNSQHPLSSCSKNHLRYKQTY